MRPQSVNTCFQKQNQFYKKNYMARIFAISYSACGNYYKSLMSVTELVFAISHILESDVFVWVDLCIYRVDLVQE